MISLCRSPKHQPFDITELVVDSDGEIPSGMAESRDNARTTSSPKIDIEEVSSKAMPPSPSKTAGADVEMAEAHASVSKTLEQPSLPPRQGKTRGADLLPAADNEQQGAAAPAPKKGAGSIVPPVPAAEEMAEKQAPQMEAALAESSLLDDQRALAGAFLESLNALKAKDEVAFFRMLSGMKVNLQFI